jgi:hypothetical protein
LYRERSYQRLIPENRVSGNVSAQNKGGINNVWTRLYQNEQQQRQKVYLFTNI